MTIQDKKMSGKHFEFQYFVTNPRICCNCARRRVPESEQTAFVMITDLLWLNRQLKYNKENKTIRLIIIENMYNIYKD